MIFDMTDYDIIIGMTLLSPYYVVLKCNIIYVTLGNLRREH